MSLSNDQKAQRLEELAKREEQGFQEWTYQGLQKTPSSGLTRQECFDKAESHKADAALLRESAAMWRERGGLQWIGDDRMTLAHYKGRGLMAFRPHGDDIFQDSLWSYLVSEIGGSGVAQRGYPDDPPVNTMEAAQAAAVAWVDAQEGK